MIDDFGKASHVLYWVNVSEEDDVDVKGYGNIDSVAYL